MGKTKLLCLISGGIDSPVAGHIMLEKGFDVVFLNLSLFPFSDRKNEDKAKRLVEILAKRHKKKLKFISVPHGKPTLEAIMNNTEEKNVCVLCRRMMYRTAEKVAKKEGAVALVTGENLGQVASQTLSNLTVEDQSIKTLVLRPLLCYDKNDIIKIAEEIGTYETSIIRAMCCTVVPTRVLTKARLPIIESEEANYNVDALLDEIIPNLESVELGT